MTPHAGLPGPQRSGQRRRPGRHGRPRVLLTLLAALAAAAVAVTGCASGSSGGSGSSNGGGTPAMVSLTFQVTHGSGPAVQHWTLRCDPAGGTHPAPAATCAALLKLKDPFAPQNKQMNCPMILRSDRRLVVTGIWFGKKVHRVVLDGGCDLSLWGKLHEIFH